MIQTKTQQLNPQIFTIWSDEIEGRIDPYFFSVEIRDFRNKLSKTKTVKLGEIIELITKGETPLWRGDNYQNEGVPFLKVQNIASENIKGKLVYISEKVDKRMKRSQLFGGELLYTMAGSIGIATIFPENFGRANINQAIAKIVLKSEINKEYIKIMLNSDLCKKQAEMALTAVAQPNINFEQIKSIQIPLPPLPIQNKIISIMSKTYEEKKRKEIKAGEILNSVDDFVLKELKIKMPEIKKEMVFEVWSDKMKSRIDSEYYQKFYKIFFNEIEKSKFPKEPLGNVTKFIMNGRTPAKEDYADSGNGVPIIKAGTASGKMVNLKKLGYVKNNFQGKQTVKKGDIFILSAAHQAEYVGKNVSLLDQELKQDTYFVGELVGIRSDQEKCLSRYLFSFLSTQFIFILMNREKRGQTSHLYPADLKNLPIPIPPLNVQKKIAEKIELYYSQSKILQKEAKEVLEDAREKVEEMILK